MEKGMVIWFTGSPRPASPRLRMRFSGAWRHLGLPVEDLDADEVRANLSPNLGYTEEARDENTKRLAWFASKLSTYGANVMIAAVAPKQAYRDRAREWCEKFVEVYVDTPLEVCQQRDPKGLYARAARGEVNDIAGMHQPYEAPANPELHIKTTEGSVEECGDIIMARLVELGYVPTAAQEAAQ
jgi:adenylyl-sulfate kinase